MEHVAGGTNLVRSGDLQVLALDVQFLYANLCQLARQGHDRGVTNKVGKCGAGSFDGAHVGELLSQRYVSAVWTRVDVTSARVRLAEVVG